MVCGVRGRVPRIAENSKKINGGKKVTRGSSDHHIPCSTSPPGGERVAVSSGGEGATVRATRTSPKHAPHPWGRACAAGAAGAPQMLCADQPWCGPNAHHVRGDRSGPLGMRPRCLGSAQNSC